MATLIHALTSGFSDAASGIAEFYARGEETPVLVYSDPEGLSAIGFTAALNSVGRRVCYARQIVDVIVKDAMGTVVAEFTEGTDANSITVESDSFTGTLPSGSQGAGGLALLQEKLDAIAASFNTKDFLVRPTGTTADQTLADALVAVSGTVFYVVTDSAYGAAGDGVADDAAAIQAAVDAAAAAGGGVVWFPAGTYLITTPIVVTGLKVSLRGVNHRASIIQNTAAAGNAISVVAGVSSYTGMVIEGLGITHSSSSTGRGINVGSTYGVTIRNCRVDKHLTGIRVSGSQGYRIADCHITSRTTGLALCIDSSSSDGTIDGCTLIMASSTASSCIALDSAQTTILACVLSAFATTGSYCVFINSNCYTHIVGCNLINKTSVDFAIHIENGVVLSEVGNTCPSGSLLELASPTADATTVARLTRDSQSLDATVASAATYVPTADTKYYFLTAQGNITIGAIIGTPTHGSEMVIWVYNGTAGNITVTGSAAATLGGDPYTVATLNFITLHLVYNATHATPGWFQVGGNAAGYS